MRKLMLTLPFVLAVGLLVAVSTIAQKADWQDTPAAGSDFQIGLEDAVAAPLSSDIPITTPILSEGFEGNFYLLGWYHSEFPTGPDPQVLSHPWVPTNLRARSGTYSVYHNDDTGMQDAWLVTPRFTPTLVSEFVFWQSENYTYAHYAHSLWISLQSGDPKDGQYMLLAQLDPAPDPGWEEIRVDLAPYAGHPIYIAFRYQGDYADEWYVDDVQVTAGLEAYHNGPREPGQVVTFTASAIMGTNVSYIWNMGSGDIRSGAVVTKVYGAAGTYTAVVTASNSASLVSRTLQLYIAYRALLPLVLHQ